MIATMHDAAREQYEAELGLPARIARLDHRLHEAGP